MSGFYNDGYRGSGVYRPETRNLSGQGFRRPSFNGQTTTTSDYGSRDTFPVARSTQHGQANYKNESSFPSSPLSGGVINSGANAAKKPANVQHFLEELRQLEETKKTVNMEKERLEAEKRRRQAEEEKRRVELERAKREQELRMKYEAQRRNEERLAAQRAEFEQKERNRMLLEQQERMRLEQQERLRLEERLRIERRRELEAEEANRRQAKARVEQRRQEEWAMREERRKTIRVEEQRKREERLAGERAEYARQRLQQQEFANDRRIQEIKKIERAKWNMERVELERRTEHSLARHANIVRPFRPVSVSSRRVVMRTAATPSGRPSWSRQVEIREPATSPKESRLRYQATTSSSSFRAPLRAWRPEYRMIQAPRTSEKYPVVRPAETPPPRRTFSGRILNSGATQVPMSGLIDEVALYLKETKGAVIDAAGNSPKGPLVSLEMIHEGLKLKMPLRELERFLDGTSNRGQVCHRNDYCNLAYSKNLPQYRTRRREQRTKRPRVTSKKEKAHDTAVSADGSVAEVQEEPPQKRLREADVVEEEIVSKEAKLQKEREEQEKQKLKLKIIEQLSPEEREALKVDTEKLRKSISAKKAQIKDLTASGERSLRESDAAELAQLRAEVAQMEQKLKDSFS